MRRTILALSLLFASHAFAQPDAGQKPTVAVLYFSPATTDPELQAFAKGFAAIVISDLATHDELKVVERERLEDAIKELQLGESRFADKSSFGKVGKMLGADYLLVGTLAKSGNTVIIGSFLMRPESTVVQKGWGKIIVKGDDIISGEDELVRKAAASLADLGVTKKAFDPPKKAFKLPDATFKTYSKALEAKDKKDKATATKLLGEVVKEQPDFKLAQLDLLSLTK
jgi:TolB-like protein